MLCRLVAGPCFPSLWGQAPQQHRLGPGAVLEGDCPMAGPPPPLQPLLALVAWLTR